MKMKKLLASAVAASVAASSLAAFASAETRSFSMGKTIGTAKLIVKGSDGIELGDNFYLTDDEFTLRTKTLGISEDAYASGLAAAEGYDRSEYVGAIIALNAWNSSAPTLDAETRKVAWVDGKDASKATINMVITGVKGTRGSGVREYTYEFKLKKGSTDTFYLPVYQNVAPAGAFLPEQFLEITSVKYTITGIDGKITTSSESLYNWWCSDKDSDTWGAGSASWGYSVGTWVQPAGEISGTFPIAGRVLTNSAYNKTEGGLLDELSKNAKFGGWAKLDSKETGVSYPFLDHTTADEVAGRKEIQPLSESDAHKSTGATAGGDESNQSYTDKGYYDGETKHDFDGLSSQVASFFNQKLNGTITFKFTTKGDNPTSDWVTGGVPSNQVGFKWNTTNVSSNDFALFFNYRQTGDLQAITELDKTNGSVTFHIDEILTALGGQTNGVVSNLFYGLTTKASIQYDDDHLGLYVEEIVLAYDEDADDKGDVEEPEDDDDNDDDDDDDSDIDEDDDDDDDDDDEDDDDDDDDDDEDDAPSVAIDPTDDDEDDAPASSGNGTVDSGIVTPPADEDDGNPVTGVSLAVIPALVAAAAVVVSKKRK